MHVCISKHEVFFPGQNRCFTAHLSARGLQKQKGLFDLHRQTSVHLENTVLTADPHCAIFNCIFFYPVIHIVMEIHLKAFNGYLGNAGLILCVSEQICCLDRK